MFFRVDEHDRQIVNYYDDPIFLSNNSHVFITYGCKFYGY